MSTEPANTSTRSRFGSMHLLVAANVVALGFLAVVELSAAARAQQRPRGTYTAASGRIEGTGTERFRSCRRLFDHRGVFNHAQR